MELTLNNFKWIKNRQRPDMCYQYKYKSNGSKCTITTFDSGKTFLLLIESLALDGHTYLKDYSAENIGSIDECISMANGFYKD